MIKENRGRVLIVVCFVFLSVVLFCLFCFVLWLFVCLFVWFGLVWFGCLVVCFGLVWLFVCSLVCLLFAVCWFASKICLALGSFGTISLLRLPRHVQAEDAGAAARPDGDRECKRRGR